MVKKAVIMKGDGIGPEVVDSMINILKECNLQSELIHCEAGSEQWGAEWLQRCIIHSGIYYEKSRGGRCLL